MKPFPIASVLILTASLFFSDLKADTFNPSRLNLPQRDLSMRTGSEFLRDLAELHPSEREAAILAEIAAGNIPSFLRKAVRIEKKVLGDAKVKSVSFWSMPDYLAIGSSEDFVRIPMNLFTAQEIARATQTLLPTSAMVDAIYQNAKTKIKPMPMKPTKEMSSVGYYKKHNERINLQLAHSLHQWGELMAGHKKDIVIAKKLNRKKNAIAIYGWHRLSGKAIQPLSTVHSADYADYSHGVRLVRNAVEVEYKNGEKRVVSMHEFLRNSKLAPILSYEGRLDRQLKLMLGENASI